MSGVSGVIAKAYQASKVLGQTDGKVRDAILKQIAFSLPYHKKKILEENQKDLTAAKKANLSPAFIERLKLTEQKIADMAAQVQAVQQLPDPLNVIVSQTQLDQGLMLYQTTVPLGLVGVIFEARPDALVQIASLCIKSGNGAIIKGGSEASATQNFLGSLIAAEVNKVAPGALVFLQSRQDAIAMLSHDKEISLLILRGSKELITSIKNNTKIPVLGHSEGICHLYVDKDASVEMAVAIAVDAKCQYPAACNSIETLLVHKRIAKQFLPVLARAYFEHGVEMRADSESLPLIAKADKKGQFKHLLKPATEKDWATEYNALIISIKIVGSLKEAIAHINQYGSKHTDAIVTNDDAAAKTFLDEVDASSVMVNCSTRFADGYRYGKGAELGINTGKIHARGPTGIEGLLTTKYQLVGSGQVVATYVGEQAKRFVHKKIK
ncbi:MAG: glutamate-5-semialdehyde dehydrogenase [Candidatus Woesearchaeota archaeon]